MWEDSETSRRMTSYAATFPHPGKGRTWLRDQVASAEKDAQQALGSKDLTRSSRFVDNKTIEFTWKPNG